jgi:hypothetical protein
MLLRLVRMIVLRHPAAPDRIRWRSMCGRRRELSIKCCGRAAQAASHQPQLRSGATYGRRPRLDSGAALRSLFQPTANHHRANSRFLDCGIQDTVPPRTRPRMMNTACEVKCVGMTTHPLERYSGGGPRTRSPRQKACNPIDARGRRIRGRAIGRLRPVVLFPRQPLNDPSANIATSRHARARCGFRTAL